MEAVIAQPAVAEREVDNGSMGNVDSKLLCKACGFDGFAIHYMVWTDMALVSEMDLPNNIVLDWVHSLLQDGMFNCEIDFPIAHTDTSYGNAMCAFCAEMHWQHPGATPGVDTNMRGLAGWHVRKACAAKRHRRLGRGMRCPLLDSHRGATEA